MSDYDSLSSAVSPFVPAKYLSLVVCLLLLAGHILSFVATKCSRPDENSWKMPLYKVLNLIAFNFNKAQNADDAKAKDTQK